MKKATLKKLLALLWAAAMLFSITACSDDSSSEKTTSEEDEEITESVDIKTGDKLEHDDMRYVLIYNPKIYDEYSKNDKSVLSSGDFGSQIDVDAFRGDGLEDEPAYGSVSQGTLNSLVP